MLFIYFQFCGFLVQITSSIFDAFSKNVKYSLKLQIFHIPAYGFHQRMNLFALIKYKFFQMFSCGQPPCFLYFFSVTQVTVCIQFQKEIQYLVSYKPHSFYFIIMLPMPSIIRKLMILHIVARLS